MRTTDKALGLQKDEEFITRLRIPTFTQFVIIFFVHYLVVCLAYYISGSLMEFSIATLVMIGIMDAIMVWSIQRARDQMLVTEFQNALYSSALSINRQFCLIVRKDGLIVHADAGFRTLRPDYDSMLHRTLEDTLRLMQLPVPEAEGLLNMVVAGNPAQVLVTLRDGTGLSQKTVVNLDPIRRPQNYFLIRGRHFVEQRNG